MDPSFNLPPKSMMIPKGEDQSDKLFRALIEKTIDGMVLSDANGIITYVSPSTTLITGFLPEELVGHTVFERLVHPEDGEATKNILAQVFHDPDKSHMFEYRTRRKDGTVVWLEITGTNLLDDPSVEAIVWNLRDITERKQLADEVAKAKEQLEIVLKNVPDAITVVDANDKLVYANETVVQLLGITSDLKSNSVRGHPHDRFMTWDEGGLPLPVEERPSYRALQGKNAQELIHYQDRITGQMRWTLVRAQPIVDSLHQVQYVVSVYTDMTERKDFEQRKDHFISMASHELKTPLTVLSAYTQLLQERLEAEGRQDIVSHLSKMDDQLTRLTKLVADLLDISKLQAGKLDLAQEIVDINKLIREVVESLQPTTTHRLLIEGAAHQTILGDRDRLAQVLMNLLANAIKYSPRAETVVVRVAQTHDTLTVSVQDFGIGIAQNHQQRLFERFYRVCSEEDQTYPGLGIGLYIAHEIIERHGGKMWVESTVGKGSLFSFSLPLR